MDDLFNDDVPPPDSQSNPEQEADNDEVSHDDVPDKIPSSGLDTILDFNEEDNRLLEQLKREKRSSPHTMVFWNRNYPTDAFRTISSASTTRRGMWDRRTIWHFWGRDCHAMSSTSSVAAESRRMSNVF